MKENEENRQEEEKWEDTAREAAEFDEDEVVLPEGPEETKGGLEEPGEEKETSKAASNPGKAQASAGSEETPGEEEKATAKEPDDSGRKAKEPDQEPKASGENTAGKNGPFRKRDKKDPKDTQIEELNDRVRRQMAEFDNFRKRTEKEKSQMFEMGAKSVIEKILPIIDNFERGLETIPEEEKDGAFADGMEKVYRQMMSTLDEIGVKAIEAEGKEFDPDLHNAVLHVDDESLGENIVAEELQKGYTYRDSVVRHSMVKVAN